MAVALVGTIGAVSLGATGAAVTPAWGTSETRAANNLLICWVDVHGVATLPTTPAGWIIAVQTAGTSCSATIYYKMAQAAGGDTAPTIAAITSGFIQAQLAEFSGVATHTTTPPDRSGVAAGTGTPIVATTGGTDAVVGDLVVVAGCSFYSAAATKTLTHTVTGGATTITSTNNNGTSLARHYNFGYGPCTSIAGAESDSFAQTTTSITGGAVVIASFKPGLTAAAGNATGTGAALGDAGKVQPAGGLATGTGAAYIEASNVQPQPGTATGTGAAYTEATGIQPGAGRATGTGQAYDATRPIPGGLATGTGAALQATASEQPAGGLATGTGSAKDAGKTVQPAGGLATGTGAAYGPDPQLQVAGGLATGTGAALQAADSLKATGGLATGVGAADDASAQVKVAGGLGTATGAAYSAPFTVTPQAGIALGVGAAIAAVPSVTAWPGVATGTGAAYGATVQSGTFVIANAILASGTGSAYDALVIIVQKATGGKHVKRMRPPVIGTPLPASEEDEEFLALLEAFDG